jgi:hypothetical protein
LPVILHLLQNACACKRKVKYKNTAPGASIQKTKAGGKLMLKH